jgi:hypothetical protein
LSASTSRRGCLQCDQRRHRAIAGWSSTVFLAGFYERAEIAAVVLPRTVQVIVARSARRIQSVDESFEEVRALHDSAWGVLVDAVEKVPDDLVGDEHPQQRQAARCRKDREQRGTVGMWALQP